MPSRRLKVVYIAPSRYDDDGHVCRYFRGVLPSNTLCCLRTLTRRLGETDALGAGVRLDVDIHDDAVQRIPVRRIIREARRPDTRLVVGLVGVQTHQFPRATDLALAFRRAGVAVMIGGFHVSGVLALFDRSSPELARLLDEGVTLVRGEVEGPGVLAGILRDALEGALKPVYEITSSPDITDAPIPEPGPAYLKRFVFGQMATIDTSRGCPFNCSFCTVINVQGRRMRARSAAAIVDRIAAEFDRGITFYFFTDDNLARSPVWNELFEGMIRLREGGRDVRFMMQVDTQAAFLPGFVERSAAAGCYRVFVGMESVNEANLAAAGKRQNHADRFAEMVEAWHRAKVTVQAGYIIGLPHDTPESVRRDVAVLRDHVKVDHAAFFMLTPLPGSRDHRNLVDNRIPLDADLNDYDGEHETFRHPNFAAGDWVSAYREAWDAFYQKERIVDALLRTPPEHYWAMFWQSLWTRYSILQQTHPMATGLFRLKDRRARRSILPRESSLGYAWRRARDGLRTARVLGRLFFEFQEIWLLTRKRRDARWSTLAALRARWGEARQRMASIHLAERRDLAARELRAMLQAAAEHLREFATAGRALRRRTRRKLAGLVRDIESYVRSLDLKVPTPRQLAQVERYIHERLLAGYEELAIRHVALRRRSNALRHDLIARWKTGRILTPAYLSVPRLMWFEVAVGVHFGLAFLGNR